MGGARGGPRAAVQILTSRAGSAGGPKPGRDRCYGELGRASSKASVGRFLLLIGAQPENAGIYSRQTFDFCGFLTYCWLNIPREGLTMPRVNGWIPILGVVAAALAVSVFPWAPSPVIHLTLILLALLIGAVFQGVAIPAA